MDLYSSINTLDVIRKAFMDYKSKESHPKYRTFVRFLASKLPIKTNIRIYSKVKNRLVYLDFDEYRTTFVDKKSGKEIKNLNDEQLLDKELSQLFDSIQTETSEDLEYDYYDNYDLYPSDSFSLNPRSLSEQNVPIKKNFISRFQLPTSNTKPTNTNNINSTCFGDPISKEYMLNSWTDQEESSKITSAHNKLNSNISNKPIKLDDGQLNDVEHTLSLIMNQLQILSKQVSAHGNDHQSPTSSQSSELKETNKEANNVASANDILSNINANIDKLSKENKNLINSNREDCDSESLVHTSDNLVSTPLNLPKLCTESPPIYMTPNSAAFKQSNNNNVTTRLPQPVMVDGSSVYDQSHYFETDSVVDYSDNKNPKFKPTTNMPKSADNTPNSRFSINTTHDLFLNSLKSVKLRPISERIVRQLPLSEKSLENVDATEFFEDALRSRIVQYSTSNSVDLNSSMINNNDFSFSEKH